MGRPPGSKNVTPDEIATIRRLFRAGLFFAEIMKQTGRGPVTIERAVKGMKRKRPSTAGRNAERNDRIVAMVEKGASHAQVARKFGLTPRTIGLVVAGHPRIAAAARRMKPTTVAARYRLELGTVLSIVSGRKVATAWVRPWL